MTWDSLPLTPHSIAPSRLYSKTGGQARVYGKAIRRGTGPGVLRTVLMSIEDS